MFLDALERIRVSHRFVVGGYVVMPEHVHLLLSEPEVGLLAHAIKALKLSVTLRSDLRPFWTARYHDFNVYSGKKMIEKRRYIHRNPVRRGLVERPEDWEWSSFRHFATGEVGVVEVESPWTARARELGQRPMSENPDMGHP